MIEAVVRKSYAYSIYLFGAAMLVKMTAVLMPTVVVMIGGVSLNNFYTHSP